MDIFDFEQEFGSKMKISMGSSTSNGLLSQKKIQGRQKRDEKTLRDVTQGIKNKSVLKFITVCKRFNIDALHPHSLHFVLALLSKTENRLELFNSLLVACGYSDDVILDMDIVNDIDNIDTELIYSVSDWLNLLSYTYCEVSDNVSSCLHEDTLVSRFSKSLLAAGLVEITSGGINAILPCMIHTFPNNTPMSQMLERYVLTHFPDTRDVEVKCLRSVSHYMDGVTPESTHQQSLGLVISQMKTIPVFTSDLQYVLLQEEQIRAMSELTENPEQIGRVSLRSLVVQLQHERTYSSTESFENWRSQLQFGVTTSMHLQLLLYFICTQQTTPAPEQYRNLYSDKIIERVLKNNNNIDNIDTSAITKIIKTIRIYKHSIRNLIDFRQQCLLGFNVKKRMSLSLAQVVQLYICCFQHKSVFEAAWKSVVPIMNHTIQTACQKFRDSHQFDVDAVVKTLIDSNVTNREYSPWQ